MKTLFHLFFSLFTLFSVAQTWQSAYDSCVKYQEKKQYKKAIEWGDKALELYEKQVSLKDTNYSNILSTQSANCYYSGYYDKAKFYAVKDSIWIIQNIGELNYRFSDCCVTLGLLYQTQGLFNLAEKLFLKAKRIDLELYGKNSDNYILVCSNLGTLYQDKGDYANAEVIYREVLHLCSDNNQFNSSCNHLCANFGLLQKLKGNYEEAEKLYKRTIHFYHENQSTENMDYVITCNNLANIYASQNRLYEAETLMIHIKSIITRLIGTEHPHYFTFTNNLAAFYQIKREYDKAEALYSDALFKVANTFGKSHPMYANILNNMGVLFLLKNKYAEAESLIVKAKEIRKEIFGNQHPEYAKSCLNLAKLYMKQYLYDRALPYLIDAIKIKMNEIENNFVVLSQQEKENYLEMNASEYFTYLNLFTLLTYKKNPSISDYAYDMAIQLKGKILQSSEKIKNRILNSKDEKLKNMYLEWKMTKDKYAKLANMTNLQRKKQQLNLDSLEQQIHELEKQLSIKSEDFAKTFLPKHTTWKEIRNTLEYNQTAIEIVRINMKDTKLTQQDSIIYIGLVVRKTSEHPEVVVLPSGNVLETGYLINYKRSTRHKMYDPYSYNAFWKPIKMVLKDAKTVYFCPDGVYHQINLSTLQNPETQKYVFDEVRIIHVTNSKDILEKNKFTSKNNYLIGNPKFNLELDTKNNEKPEEQRSIENLSQLEGAEKEVKQISAILPNAKTAIGIDATEEYIKSIKNPRILHIATHGYFKKGQYQSSAQAMLNAGLLFAGVVDYDRMDIRPLDKEDGKLTAYEVMNMELDSTELVVLSACETGLGQASKEGVYGLQRAFKVAGAQTIIMSLWKVNDEATQLLMTKFYENWQKKGMNKRKAFETAQKDLRKQYKEPYYWGAFVMIE